MLLRTNYSIGEIPHGEHPLPQERRDSWLCLNGEWDFYKLHGENKYNQGKITVPFSPETLLSGVTKDEENAFVLHAGEKLVYSRKVTLDKSLLLGKTLLRFGAVDHSCEVFINGQKAGGHQGGFTAFCIDGTPFFALGENEITVVVTDEGTRNHGARGKQNDKRGGIWYTPQSGIWQTVWIESMPKKHIRDLRITTSAEERSVTVCADCFGEELTLAVFDGEKSLAKVTFTGSVTLALDFELWSPENPKLYDCVISSISGDRVHGYFGVRSFGQTTDEKGVARLTLNGKPYFFNGVLDQGYWSDGMLTYPCEQAIIDELTLVKNMGFNTLRKHIKIEPMRWYYHCDRLGIVVWQDFVNGGGEYKFTHVAAFPFLGFHHKDNDYKYFARENEYGRAEFAKAVDETLTQLYNCTCIGVWVPFNEGWGQFDSAKWTEYIRAQDPTRIIDSVSGWHDQGVGKTDLKSLHTYYTPLKVPKDERPVVLSEFGGYSMKTENHVFDTEKEFGYKTFQTQETLVAALEKLYLEKLPPLITKGLCGCIYTQVSDVEEEINGLVTYDRKVVKIPVETMAAINAKITAESNKVK